MTDFRDRFERQLVEAAERVLAAPPPLTPGPSARPPRRGRLRLPRRGMLAVAVAVVAGGSALAATHPWSPPLGDPRVRGPRPVVAADAPPPEQLRLLGVLRRAANPDDHGPEVRAALRYVGPSTRGVRTDYVRRLDHGGGAAITLIPAQRWDGVPRLGPIRDALCVFAAEPNGDGGGHSCWSMEMVLRGRAVAGLGSRVYGLVPDGVATVDLHLRDGRVEPVTVYDNFFDYTGPPPGADGRTTGWDRIVWRDAGGAPVPQG